MKIRGGQGSRIALALVLLVAGGGFLWLGFRGLDPGEPAANPVVTSADPEPTAAQVMAPTTPVPSATEPILPPPPTVSPTPSGQPGEAVSVAKPGTASPSLTAGHTASPESLATVKPATEIPTAGPTMRATPALPTAMIAPSPGAYPVQRRLGVCAAGMRVTEDLAGRLGLGWYLDWSAKPDRYRPAGVEYMPMIRLRDGNIVPKSQALMEAVDAQPGALWLIGNEPDVKWQDNTSAEVYAQAYHDLYLQLKKRDPTCRVAIGGVSQPTPLRLRYLDQILDAYQRRYGEPMPVDVWNVHNFILREELGSWGVDIPPGMPDRTGRLSEIADHDDMGIFRQQIVDFRRWMKDRGQQDKPLIVTEYGILMPADYGFPPKEVKQFMLATFDYFNTAADPALGDPADGYRLVQRWCWYGLADERYPTGNLVDASTGALTALGQAFHDWAVSAR